MSDYLNDLAARNLNPTIGIRPRLPGLFEPVQVPGEMRWLDPEIETANGPGMNRLRPTTFSSLDETASASLETLSLSDPKAPSPPEGPARQLPRVEPHLLAIQISAQYPQNPAGALRTRSLDPISAQASVSMEGSVQPRDSFLPSESLTQLPPQVEAAQREQRSVGRPQVISSSSASARLEKSSQQRDALLTSLSSTDMPATFPVPSDENDGAVHSPVKQKEPDDGSEPSPRWTETKHILEAARTHARVKSFVSRQLTTGNVSSKEMEHACLSTGSKEEQEPPSALPRSQAKAIEGPAPIFSPAGTIIIRPAIKPARPSETGAPRRPVSASLERAESLPEAIIHVTIGRVEVRAASPIQTKRAPSPKPSTLGLDEYLQRFESKR